MHYNISHERITKVNHHTKTFQITSLLWNLGYSQENYHNNIKSTFLFHYPHYY